MLELVIDDKSKFNTLFLEFAIVTNKIMAKYANIIAEHQPPYYHRLFKKIKKEFEQQHPGTLLVMNYPSVFNKVSSTAQSDFMCYLTYYVPRQEYTNKSLETYQPIMLELAEKIKEKIKFAFE